MSTDDRLPFQCLEVYAAARALIGAVAPERAATVQSLGAKTLRLVRGFAR